ncbi:MAG: protein kinase [Verrucomicrobiota bacterium]
MSEAETDAQVQSCPACGAKVDTSKAEPLARVACPKCGEKLRVDRSFDNFLLLETLGTGGMGTVYKARDTQLDRLVALKLLRSEAGSATGPSSQLQHEARVTASINHPHVVKVYSLGSDHGQFYVVMELVDHGSLEDLIEQLKRVPEERVLDIGIQIANGLAAAQEKGLIHRDIKPANILFSDEQTAKIVDFGLAGAAEQKTEAKGEIWATPYYVAPENLNNEPEDFRSDIYSLGATLFQALAGRPPIEGETNSASALRELKNQPLVLAEVAPDISDETSRTIMRMLAPNPAQRFSSYQELIKALQRAKQALHPSEQGPATSRRRLPVIFALIVFLAACGVGAFLWWQKSGSRGTVTIPPEANQLGKNASLAQRYEQARQQLLAGKYDVASQTLVSLSKEAGNQQPLLNWIRMHRALAALLSRKSSEMEAPLGEIETDGVYSTAPAEAPLARFFLETAKALRRNTPVPAVEGKVSDADSSKAFALLLFGLKDFELKNFAEAQKQLEQFIGAQPVAPFVWIKDYKAIAQKYLDDCRLYAAWKAQPKNAGNTKELSVSLANLREVQKKLQIRGALADQLQAEEKQLASDVAGREKAENEIKERQRRELIEKENPAWKAMVSAYQGKVKAYDFAGAADAINKAQFSEPSLKESQANLAKKAQWLIDWKADFIEDVNRGGFSGKIFDITGLEYTGIKHASSSRLNVSLPRGMSELDWTKFSPKTILAIANSLIKKAPPADAADRQWLSAVFAAETGQPAEARFLAKAAADAKAEYRDYLPLIAPEPVDKAP